jgi:5-methylthioadenosine/S-adenosylhomocysteine deaminase
LQRQRRSTTMPRRVADEFNLSYGKGVVDGDPPLPAGALSGPGIARAAIAPAEPLALHGTILSEDKTYDGGYLVVAGAEIAEVRETRPEQVRIVETDGVIVPGLVDLHGHPEYNIFAPWEPPHLYLNRYEWREHSPEYDKLVKAPWRALKEAGLVATLTRFAEIRALVGGTTAIQGSQVSPLVHSEALVRNVDRWIFDGQPGRSIVDLGARRRRRSRRSSCRGSRAARSGRSTSTSPRAPTSARGRSSTHSKRLACSAPRP